MSQGEGARLVETGLRDCSLSDLLQPELEQMEELKVVETGRNWRSARIWLVEVEPRLLPDLPD